MGKQKKQIGKAYKVKLTLPAQQNIDEITGYIAFIKKQPLNAIKAGNAIFSSFDKISANPFAFKENYYTYPFYHVELKHIFKACLRILVYNLLHVTVQNTTHYLPIIHISKSHQ